MCSQEQGLWTDQGREQADLCEERSLREYVVDEE